MGDILLVTSSGGVLLDLLALRPWWEKHDRRWVAVAAMDTEALLADESVEWTDELEPGQWRLLLTATVASGRLLQRSRPDVVISAGTGVALPWFLAARALGISRLWLETLNLVGEPGRAARSCARLATRTLVQKPALVRTRRRAVLLGELY
ncbi:MAG: hypothetical protein WKF43_05935 [Acidimicrobiales bacterium]